MRETKGRNGNTLAENQNNIFVTSPLFKLSPDSALKAGDSVEHTVSDIRPFEYLKGI